jgi:hypothetical protein
MIVEIWGRLTCEGIWSVQSWFRRSGKTTTNLWILLLVSFDPLNLSWMLLTSAGIGDSRSEGSTEEAEEGYATFAQA